MIAFEDVQNDAKTKIAANAYFVGETVIEDRGELAGETAHEAALNGRGFCVTVLPVFSGTLVGQSYSKVVLNCLVVVLVEVNPETNPGGANKDIYEAVKAVISTLLSHDPTNPNDNYVLAGGAIEYSDTDPGLLGYSIQFNKKCVI